MEDTTGATSTTADLLLDIESGEHGIRYKEDKLEHLVSGVWTEIEAEDNVRYQDSKLQYLVNGVWTDIELDCTKDSGDIHPDDVSGISATAGDGQISLMFNDPTDVYWTGTKVVRKAGAYPKSIRDGVVVLDNKTRGAYATTAIIDIGLTNGTTYYYHFFPYTDAGGINANAVNRISGAPVATAKTYKIYGVQIDLTNSNPETSVTYTDDAVGMTGGSSVWDTMPIFKDIKPCLFKNGAVVGYLNKNNFAQFEDGTIADITSGAAGDVMIEFPKAGLVMSTVGDIVTLKMTDNPSDPNFHYYAHTRTVEGEKEHFYLGAYKGYVASSKLRSLSGKAPTSNQTIGTFRTQAQANGTGYENSGFFQLTFRQALYLIKYKNLNSQATVGIGYSDNVNNTAPLDSGTLDSSGMTYGNTTDGTVRMKLFGLEDFWGNVFEWIDGVYNSANFEILTATNSFNDVSAGYTNRGIGSSANIGGVMSKPQGTTETGFVLKKADGTDTTYFCDCVVLYASSLYYFGGAYTVPEAHGAFQLVGGGSSTLIDPGVGARLMYL